MGLLRNRFTSLVNFKCSVSLFLINPKMIFAACILNFSKCFFHILTTVFSEINSKQLFHKKIYRTENIKFKLCDDDKSLIY